MPRSNTYSGSSGERTMSVKTYSFSELQRLYDAAEPADEPAVCPMCGCRYDPIHGPLCPDCDREHPGDAMILVDETKLEEQISLLFVDLWESQNKILDVQKLRQAVRDAINSEEVGATKAG